MASATAGAAEGPVTNEAAGEAGKKLNPEKLHGVTVSELVFRVPEQAWIGTVKEGLKVDILEAMRAYGFNAMGAENLVFGTDKSDDARFVLGGTISELECRGAGQQDCRITVKWELMDRRRDQVVYRVLTRGIEKKITKSDSAQGFRRLLLAALRSLMARQQFEAALAKNDEEPEPDRLKYEKATFLACVAKPLRMPANAKKILDATVLVQSGEALGSGVVISGDGFVLTAAHVLVSDDNHVEFQNGVKYEAKAIRIDRRRDVALLKIDESEVPCVKPKTKPAEMGEKIYAIGSPASSELAFSLTTGIVSAFREWENTKFIQTDASINRGNSGGPLLNKKGQVLGIVSWKLAGIGIEGIAFGVPIHAAFEALGLEPGEATAAELTEPVKIEMPEDEQEVFEDEADPYVSLDIEAEIREAQHERASPLSKWSKGVGIGAAAVGSTLVLWSALFGEITETEAEFHRWRLLNDIGWVSMVAGAALWAGSYFLLPKVEAQDVMESKTKAGVEASVGFTGNLLVFGVRY